MPGGGHGSGVPPSRADQPRTISHESLRAMDTSSSQSKDQTTLVHRAVSKYCLRGLTGDTAGKVFPLKAQSVVGRREDCDIVLDDPGVSRHHAVLEVSGEAVILKDLNASNGTFVNGRQIRVTALKAGDELAFDEVRFVFEEAGRRPAAPAAVPPRAADQLPADTQTREPVTGLFRLPAEKAPAIGWPTAIAILIVLLALLFWL